MESELASRPDLLHRLATFTLVLFNATTVISIIFIITWTRCRKVPKQMKILIINLMAVFCLSGPVSILMVPFMIACIYKLIYWAFITTIIEFTSVLLLLDQFLSVYCPFWYVRCSTMRLHVTKAVCVLSWPLVFLTIVTRFIDWSKGNTSICTEEMFQQQSWKLFCLTVTSTFMIFSSVLSLLVWRKIRQKNVGPVGHLCKTKTYSFVNVVAINIVVSLFQLPTFVATIILNTTDVTAGSVAVTLCIMVASVGVHCVYGIILPSILIYRFKECRAQFVILFCHCVPRLRTMAKQTRTVIYMEAAGIPTRVDVNHNPTGINVISSAQP